MGTNEIDETEETAAFLVHPSGLFLLGEKGRGIDEGFLMPPGGKLERNETPENGIVPFELFFEGHPEATPIKDALLENVTPQ